MASTEGRTGPVPTLWTGPSARGLDRPSAVHLPAICGVQAKAFPLPFVLEASGEASVECFAGLVTQLVADPRCRVGRARSSPRGREVFLLRSGVCPYLVRQ